MQVRNLSFIGDHTMNIENDKRYQIAQMRPWKIAK